MATLTEQLNEWWEEREQIPDELLKARVVLLFKQGSTKLITNYRPISLLNTTITMFAAILKVRIAEKSITTYTKHNTGSGKTKAQHKQS